VELGARITNATNKITQQQLHNIFFKELKVFENMFNNGTEK
jgi:hypothetical protein